MSVHTTAPIAVYAGDSKCNNVIESSIVPCYFDNISRTLIELQDRNTLSKGGSETLQTCQHKETWKQSLLICLPSPQAFIFNLNINFPLLTQSWKFVLRKREGNSSSDKTSLRWHQIHPSKSTFKSFIEHIFVIYLVEPFPIPRTVAC